MMNEMCYTRFSINERGLLIMKTTFYKLRRNRAVSGVLEEEMYGTGPRKRKEAEAIKEEDGWFW